VTPQAVDLEAAESESVEPESVEPEATEPEATEPETTEPEPAPVTVAVAQELEPEWEDVPAAAPTPAPNYGHELAAVVGGLEAELPAAKWEKPLTAERRTDLRRHLVFAINDENYAVNLENLLEVDNMPAWTGIPGLPPTVRGLINLRGEIVSLLELRAILGLPYPAVVKKGKIFVATTSDRQSVSAFAVDEIEGIIGFDPELITPVPPFAVAGPASKGVTATVEENGRLIRVLDISAVLTDVEKTFSLDQVWM
jgi:purine-binding chemotaxis protein CheW